MTGKLNIHKQCVIPGVIWLGNGLHIKNIVALIDTGSYYSFFSKKLLHETMNPNGKMAEYGGLSFSKQKSPLYDFVFEIPELGCSFPHEFALQDTFENIDILIGTDFLSSCIFKYNYPNEGEFFLDLLSKHKS